ncbi:unnamed protein product [Cunninghamella blakesleeana]
MNGLSLMDLQLTIQPLEQLSNIRINSRYCHITKILVNGINVEVNLSDPISELTLGSNTNITHHQVYKSKYLSALRNADEGELYIRIPQQCIKQLTESEAQLISNQVYLQNHNDLNDDTNDKNISTNQTPVTSYAPILIRIDFKLEDPRAGIVFVEPDDDVAPYRSHHLYTVNQPLPGATRAWLPCIDRIGERCTWDMEFVVPRRMGVNSMDIETDTTYDEDATVVVCSGEMVEQVIHPKDPSKKIVHYNLSVPTSAPFIGFAIGPFEMIKLSPSQLQEEVLNAAELDESQQQSLMAEINMMSNIFAFALPGYKEELNNSCTFLMHAMHFYAQEYGSYPFSDFKLVFVDDAWSDTASSASLAICNSRLLHDSTIIDQTYITRQALSLALARQWFGVHIIQKTWMDTWLIVGLANLMGSLFIKRHLGNNEYRLRLKKDMELCCSLDVNRAPLYNPALPSPLDPDDLSFLELKAPLVLYMLDKRMCKMGATLGLSRVIPKILVSAMSGELSQNAISTHYFMRLCRKISGFDTKTFADHWIYKSGCPKFSFSFHFNRKKMVVELFMKQENTNSFISNNQSGDNTPLNDGGVLNYQEFMAPLFTGNLTVRIHEADGTPYEHILDIQSSEHKFEVQFNTKYKRIRRNTKRFRAKQAAAAAAVAEEEHENEEGGEPGTTSMLGIIPSLGLGMPIFEEQSKKEEWQVYEWGQGDEDTSGAASAMFDWIRLDAEFEWLTTINFQQPDYMWAAQLTKDCDVVAQHEAICALQHMPSLQTSTSLLRALLDSKCFYKIRMESAYALASCAQPGLNWVGLLQLGKMFNQRYCFPTNTSYDMDVDDDIPFTLAIPKPNNFSSIPDYFIQKAVIIAFSEIRNDYGLTPIKIRQFLLDLLKYNDNIGNEFSDCYYIATMISALGDSLIPSPNHPDAIERDTQEGKSLVEAAQSEIERFRTLDYVIPTYHNTVTVACLKTITKLMINNLMDVNIAIFLPYTRYGNFLEVRLTAFDSLFVLSGLLNSDLTKYFLSVIKEDPCAYVSHYVSRAMLIWLGLALNDESNVPQSKLIEEFAEEEGKATTDDEKKRLQRTVQQEFQYSVEILRKRFENNEELQQNLWDLLNAPENITIDHSIRKYLLQFCEYVYKPIDVGLKVTIRVPALQIHDTPEDISEPVTPVQPIIRFSKPKLPSKEKKDTEGDQSKIPPSIRSYVSKNVDEATNDQSSPSSTISSRPSSPTSPVTQNISEMKLTTTVKPSKQPKPTVPKVTIKKTHKLPSSEWKKIRRIYNKLQKNRAAAVFLLPVNEELDGAPGYYNLIKNPMDLAKIKDKIDAKLYTSFTEFEDDIRLMLNNCYLYNVPGSFAYNQGQILEAVLDKELLKGREGSDEGLNMTIVESREPSPTPITLPTIPKVEQITTDTQITKSPSTIKIKQEPIEPSDQQLLVQPKQYIQEKQKQISTEQPQQVLIDRPKQKHIEKLGDQLFEHSKSKLTEQTKPKLSAVDQQKPKIVDQPKPKVVDQPKPKVVDQPKLKAVDQPKPKVVDQPKPKVVLEQPKPKIIDQPKPIPTDHQKQTIVDHSKTKVVDHPKSKLLDQSKLKSTDLSHQKPIEQSKPKIMDHPKQKYVEQSILHSPQPPHRVLTPPHTQSPPRPHITSKQPLPKPSSSPSTSHSLTANQPVPRPRTDKDICAAILAKTMESPHSFEFIRPVDPIKQGIPQYYEIIKKPMDLGTIKSKLKNNQYLSVQQFDDDVHLMFNNCYKFNPPDTYVYNEAKQLEQVYSKQYKMYFDSSRLVSSSSVVSSTPTTGSKSSKEKHINNSTASTLPSPVKRDIIPTVSSKKAAPSPSSSSSSSSSKAPSPVNTTIKKPTKSTSSSPTTSVIPTEVNKSNKSSSQGRSETFETQMTPRNIEKCRNILMYLWNRPDAIPFRYPIDVVALNIPTYLEIIERPMDLSEIRKRLEEGAFKTIWEFEKDVRQIFWNCFKFNDINSAVSQQGQSLQSDFNSLWYKNFADPNCIKGDDDLIAKQVLSSLVEHPYSEFFREPVDNRQLPDYKDKVSSPMDLRTISEKLYSGRYTSLQQFDSDVRLIFGNCYKYNRPRSFAYERGKGLEKLYQNSIGKDLKARLKDKQRPATPSHKTPTHKVSPHKTTSDKQRPSTPLHKTTSDKQRPSTPSHKMTQSEKQRPSTPLHRSTSDKQRPSTPLYKSTSDKQRPSTPSHKMAHSITPPVPLSHVEKSTNLKPSSPLIKQHSLLPPTTPSSILNSPNTANINRSTVTTPSPIMNKSQINNNPVTSSSSSSTILTTSSKTPTQTSISNKSSNTSLKSSGTTPAKPLAGLYSKLDALLVKLKRNEQISYPFLEPVDPIALNIPHYATIVPNPMDLGTMTKKLRSGVYKSLKEFESDFRLIVTNCILFNGPDHVISGLAKQLDNVFTKEMQAIKAKEEQLLSGNKSSGPHKSKSSSNKKPSSSSTIKSDVKKYKPVLDKLKYKEYYNAFAVPVDPVALQIPTYYDYVKNPMDFGTIVSKLNKYPDAESFLNDAKQVFVNCYLFNPPDDIVTDWGRRLEHDFKTLCNERGLKTININMEKEREIAEAAGATLQDLSYYEALYKNNNVNINNPANSNNNNIISTTTTNNNIISSNSGSNNNTTNNNNNNNNAIFNNNGKRDFQPDMTPSGYENEGELKRVRFDNFPY